MVKSASLGYFVLLHEGQMLFPSKVCVNFETIYFSKCFFTEQFARHKLLIKIISGKLLVPLVTDGTHCQLQAFALEVTLQESNKGIAPLSWTLGFWITFILLFFQWNNQGHLLEAMHLPTAIVGHEYHLLSFPCQLARRRSSRRWKEPQSSVLPAARAAPVLPHCVHGYTKPLHHSGQLSKWQPPQGLCPTAASLVHLTKLQRLPDHYWGEPKWGLVSNYFNLRVQE